MAFSEGVRVVAVMETVARFPTAEDAYLFRSYLESEGIGAHVLDEHNHRQFLISPLNTAWPRVVVADEDFEMAAGHFHEYESRTPMAPALLVDGRFRPLAILASFMASIPFLLFGKKPPESGSGNS